MWIISGLLNKRKRLIILPSQEVYSPDLLTCLSVLFLLCSLQSGPRSGFLLIKRLSYNSAYKKGGQQDDDQANQPFLKRDCFFGGGIQFHKKLPQLRRVRIKTWDQNNRHQVVIALVFQHCVIVLLWREYLIIFSYFQVEFLPKSVSCPGTTDLI